MSSKNSTFFHSEHSEESHTFNFRKVKKLYESNKTSYFSKVS